MHSSGRESEARKQMMSQFEDSRAERELSFLLNLQCGEAHSQGVGVGERKAFWFHSVCGLKC